MQICVRHSVHTVFITAAVGLACVPAICHAQESTLAAQTQTLTAPLGAAPTASLTTASGIAAANEPIDAVRLSGSPSAEVTPARSLGVMLPLYASFAALQVMDAHSTMRALHNGGTESNPLLRDFADQPAALLAVKAGVTASTILLTERLRSKHRVGAIALMAALDSFYAMVVVHNYRTIH